MRVIYVLMVLVLVGCTSDSGELAELRKEIEELKSQETQNSKEAEKTEVLNIDYKDLKSFKEETGLYAFEVPKGLYKWNKANEYISDVLNSSIVFYFTETSQIDDPNAIWEKKDLIKKMKENIKVSYSVEKNDWVVVSGTDNNGKIIYKKGYYFKPEDNHMGENGRNVQPWCFTGVLEISYHKTHQSEFDKLIPIIIKSFKCDFLSQCLNCF